MKVTVTLANKNTVEVDMTLEQFKEFVGVNGHNANGSGNARAVPLNDTPSLATSTYTPDYGLFYRSLTQNAKRFLEILTRNPNGISADQMAEQLGFNAPVQIGGMTGGGMSKTAGKFGLDVRRFYTRQVKFENGERRVIYKPGPDIGKLH